MEFQLPITPTLQALLQQEDTDGDKKITIEDSGPKAFQITSKSGEEITITGTYALSNLLQELIWAEQSGNKIATISIAHINEAPADRISRMIKTHYWNGLTRTMDATGIKALLQDTKNEALEAETKLRVYVPYSDTFAFNYYTALQKELSIDVIQLPKKITPQYVKSINNAPGILSLHLYEENGTVKGSPFVVPGGRFNEMYGWDSYFEAIGLLLDGRVDLAKGMADNFQYEITHYGKILNANRSYYLTRTQPPFYSSLLREIFEVTKDLNWLRSHLETAIIAYESVWMVPGKRQTENGLNRYLAEGIGKPPEAEAGHFHHEFQQYAEKAGMTVEAYEAAYTNGTLQNEALDSYFVHDRSVRESGHDTSYRLEGICADLNLVELNAFLYKYETDFALLIRNEFEDHFTTASGKKYTSQYFKIRAKERKERVNQLLWNESEHCYFDYHWKTQRPHPFISATSLLPLWAELCSHEQAEQLVTYILPKLKEKGGISSCTEESRGTLGPNRPQKQWDYPNGWAPHQMMIWKGLLQYGYRDEAQELIYRWLYMITKNAVDYNGTIPEKYDVVQATHKVFAEYGNVGTDFEYITTEGFGWMNASFQYGLSLLEKQFIRELNALTPPKKLF
tara:strand:- start:9355 stop:11226 length:1872 start_codon:yes stop_codon:yes gene_type:complete